MPAAQGGGIIGTPAKLESLKEEEEELRRRVEQSKLLELQAEYHRKSLAQLTDVLGELRDTMKESAPAHQSPAEVYGVPLATHLERFGCEIAAPISACVRMLLIHGMQEEGLFRLAAGASILKKLKASLGAGARDLAEFINEPHAVAGALKSYLRELPEPLMTSELFDDWMRAASVKEPEKRQESFREVCAKLPPENYNNLRFLIKFLAKLGEHQEVNKMTPSNIAIVLGPNLLWAKSDGGNFTLRDCAPTNTERAPDDYNELHPPIHIQYGKDMVTQRNIPSEQEKVGICYNVCSNPCNVQRSPRGGCFFFFSQQKWSYIGSLIYQRRCNISPFSQLYNKRDPSMLDMASASPILVVSVVEGLISCCAEVFPGGIVDGFLPCLVSLWCHFS
ncbi:hypothetical protein AB205_0204910 [Aquarana catesbeiana]|uniref:Rho-GAP domain-containing protein n=1 Tax=Aquarana catesbeiana TaxID=8400 RepID=A0A2G9RRW9_AQUCT|nr:hypothetical protein AB205_0204910 [Aquarana catesbeiana]